MSVVNALAYMQATSIANRVRQRVKRLRQPKYLIGAVAGAAYIYFFLLRHMIGPSTRGHALPMGGESMQAFGAIAALVVAGIVAYAWIVPSDRAALRFSEAETDFLFPAPISRTGLIHFSVLRAQLAIFVSVFIVSLLLRRGGSIGVHPLQYATALWLVAATMRLHFLGASFSRERLLDLGVRPIWRRAIAIAVVLAIVAIAIAWVRTQPAPPALRDWRDIAHYVGATFGHGPIAVVLTPFRWLTAPLLATTSTAFLHAVPAALGLLVAHYVWVVRSQVSFEEASIALAAKRAETVRAVRDGRFKLRGTPTRARRPPFALAARGFAPIAFLWKGLIAAGPVWRLRTFVIAAVVVLALTQWLSMDPLRRPFLQIVGVVALSFAAWGTVVGPMLVQRSLRDTLDRLDILRAMPLRGWQIALGQLLTPVAMLVPLQWLLLLAAARAFGNVAWLTPGLVAALALAVLLLAPLLCALMLCVPFAGLLVFPGWSGTGRGGGIDVMGQRLIFGGVYMLALAVSLLPAGLVAGALGFGVHFIGSWPIAIAVAAVAAAAVLAGEVMLLVRWLGARIERFDVATELR